MTSDSVNIQYLTKDKLTEQLESLVNQKKELEQDIENKKIGLYTILGAIGITEAYIKLIDGDSKNQ